MASNLTTYLAPSGLTSAKVRNRPLGYRFEDLPKSYGRNGPVGFDDFLSLVRDACGALMTSSSDSVRIPATHAANTAKVMIVLGGIRDKKRPANDLVVCNWIESYHNVGPKELPSEADWESAWNFADAGANRGEIDFQEVYQDLREKGDLVALNIDKALALTIRPDHPVTHNALGETAACAALGFDLMYFYACAKTMTQLKYEPKLLKDSQTWSKWLSNARRQAEIILRNDVREFSKLTSGKPSEETNQQSEVLLTLDPEMASYYREHSINVNDDTIPTEEDYTKSLNASDYGGDAVSSVVMPELDSKHPQEDGDVASIVKPYFPRWRKAAEKELALIEVLRKAREKPNDGAASNLSSAAPSSAATHEEKSTADGSTVFGSTSKLSSQMGKSAGI